MGSGAVIPSEVRLEPYTRSLRFRGVLAGLPHTTYTLPDRAPRQEGPGIGSVFFGCLFQAPFDRSPTSDFPVQRPPTPVLRPLPPGPAAPPSVRPRCVGDGVEAARRPAWLFEAPVEKNHVVFKTEPPRASGAPKTTRTRSAFFRSDLLLKGSIPV